MPIVQITDNSKRIQNFKNGVVRSYHNKKISLTKTDIGYIFESVVIDKENANEPASQHICVKGVVSVNQIQISKETLEAFMLNAMDVLNRGL